MIASPRPSFGNDRQDRADAAVLGLVKFYGIRRGKPIAGGQCFASDDRGRANAARIFRTVWGEYNFTGF